MLAIYFNDINLIHYGQDESSPLGSVCRYDARNSTSIEVLQNGSSKDGHFVMEVYAFPAKLVLLQNGRELTVRVGKQVR